MELSFTEISNRLEIIKEKITLTCQSVGRDPKSIRLVVVTKGHDFKTLSNVIKAGVVDIGENYVEEAMPKIDQVSNESIRWHMVGHIQSRKAKPVAEYFDYVHSVDRLKIARRLDTFSRGIGKNMPVLLECNISGEATKSGYNLKDKENWGRFADEISNILEYQNINVKGLMTMPPFELNLDRTRLYFRKLRELSEFLMINLPAVDWSELSMGMSNDYIQAIEEGATIVRIGTAIVGRRK